MNYARCHLGIVTRDDGARLVSSRSILRQPSVYAPWPCLRGSVAWMITLTDV